MNLDASEHKRISSHNSGVKSNGDRRGHDRMVVVIKFVNYL